MLVLLSLVYFLWKTCCKHRPDTTGMASKFRISAKFVMAEFETILPMQCVAITMVCLPTKLHTHIHTYTHTYIHKHIHTHTHTLHTHTHMHTYTHTHIYTHIHTHTHTHMHTHKHTLAPVVPSSTTWHFQTVDTLLAYVLQKHRLKSVHIFLISIIRRSVYGRIILRWIFKKWDGGMEWIDLAQERNKWRALVKAAMNLRVP